MNDRIYDIAFSMDQSLSLLEKKFLMDHYGTSREILKIPVPRLKNIIGRNWTGKSYRPDHFIGEAHKMLPFIEKSGIHTLRYDEDDYPPGLLQIADPPFLLYYRGNPGTVYEKNIAVVGTRTPNQSGIKRTGVLAKHLAENGYNIISGLASGIDSLAHFHCIKGGGRTIAVLGCGIDRIYPAANKDLARSILDHNGAIISEYPPGFMPRKWYFPKRNRIVVGLCKSVLVIQSPRRSGSLISANLAADYNRDLLVASPGTSEKDLGNRDLLLSGGTEIKCISDLDTALEQPWKI